jgi:hypothetical protein
MTLSMPVKIVALVGLALALGAAGVLFLVSSNSKAPAATPPKTHAPTVRVVQIHSTKVVNHAPAKPKLQLDSNLPKPLLQSLQHSREVVAFVYSPASATDRALLLEAKAGAKLAGVGFVALDVQQEVIAEAVYGWAGSTEDPDTLVVRRPGTVAFTLAGTIDRDAVAQAATR